MILFQSLTFFLFLKQAKFFPLIGLSLSVPLPGTFILLNSLQVSAHMAPWQRGFP